MLSDRAISKNLEVYQHSNQFAIYMKSFILFHDNVLPTTLLKELFFFFLVLYYTSVYI